MIFIIFITIAQLFLFLIHYIMYRFGIQEFYFLEKHKIFFGAIIFILSCSYSISMSLVRLSENNITKIFNQVSSIWLGTIVWIFIAIVICLILKRTLNNTYNSNISLVFILISLGISLFGIYNSQRISLVEKDIYLENLPEDFNGLSVMFIADTHYGNIHTEKKSNRDVKFIKKVSPDALFVAGDFFDGPSKKMDDFSKPYAEIDPTFGKYFISGNHETYADLQKSIESVKKVNFEILDNQIKNIQDIQFVGIPYTTSTKTDIDKNVTENIIKKSDKTKPVIVIKHVPINTESISDLDANFAFFGHTHKGQMWPFSMIVKKMYGKHYYGFTQEKNTLFYTTSGVGGWGPIQRIGTNSEMLLIRFHKK